MIIKGLSKLTLLDYPEHTAATVFTGGCNLRCPFCHNSDLVLAPSHIPDISPVDFFAWLGTRTGKLEGICITGGEPTLSTDLADFIRDIHNMHFKIKLDTNGFRPDVLENLLTEGLLNYVAIDIKNSRELYAKTCGLEQINLSLLDRSMKLLSEYKASHPDFQYEYRTTVVKGLHTISSVTDICKWIPSDSDYYLQSFVDSGNILGFNMSELSGEECQGSLAAFDDAELMEICKEARKIVPKTSLRGV